MSDLAFVFPGQGSQQVGMLKDAEAAVAATFNKASGIHGYNLWDLIQQGPEAKLSQTEFTQNALLNASVAPFNINSLESPDSVSRELAA